MAKDILDLLQRVKKAAPDAVVLASEGADPAALQDLEQRVGSLPASWRTLISRHDGGTVCGLELWPAARVAREGETTVVFGMAVDDGEPLWWDRARPIADELFCGQGDLREPTGGGAPGFEHLITERAWQFFDELDMPPRRALRALADHAKARGGRVSGGGISFAVEEDGRDLPIQKLRGSRVPHEQLDDPLRAAVMAVLGAEPTIRSVESRIDHPLVHARGRAELALWVETEGPVRGARKATGAMVRIAQPVWKGGLEGRPLGDIGWLVSPGKTGLRQQHVDRDPVAIDVPGAREALVRVLERHLAACGVDRG